jgi:hypothetical protein
MPGKHSQSFLNRKIMTFLMILLSVTLLIPLSGCDGKKSETTAGPTGTSASTAASTSASTADAITTTTAAPTEGTTTAVATAATETTSAPTEATTTSTTASPTTTGVTETRLGYVIGTSTSGPQTIDIDYVEMYSGDVAIVKAKEDGSDVVEIDEEGHEYIPNDYYIRNNNPLIRTFELASDCEILMIPEMYGPDATLVCDFDYLHNAVDDHRRLMEVEVVNGLVKKITEFYVP